MQYLYAVKALYQKTFFALLLSIILLLNSCGTTESETGSCHNKILFTSSRSGKEQLYMMNPDGTNITQITSGEYSHSNGRWSPDASKIVCNTEEGTTTAGFEMVVMNSDGSNRKLLGYGNQMSWYPDGSAIIFSYWQGAEVGIFNNKLFSIDPEGKNREVISEKYVGNHTFSPDGSKIAFTVKPDSVTRIVILDYPQFNNPEYVGPISSVNPSWSPNSNEIVFSHKETNSNSEDSSMYDIYVININENFTVRMTNHSSKEHYYFPCWSSDGGKILFLSYTTDGTQKSYLYMVNKDGTDLHKVIDDDYVTSCDWSK